MREALRKRTAFCKRQYLAANSLTAYATGIRAFVLFMLFYFPGVPVMPVTDEHLADFVCFLSEAIAPQSIKIYIYGVRAFHLCHGFAFQPRAQRFPVWRAMQGVKRIMAP